VTGSWRRRRESIVTIITRRRRREGIGRGDVIEGSRGRRR
jgi:hypothetical protein